MEPRTLQFVVEACAGELMSGLPETKIRRVGTDSRRVEPGDLFFAIQGERFDGHDFLADVIQQGVTAVVVERDKAGRMFVVPPKAGVVVVSNTRRALGKLAARYRADFDIPLIAVAGSNGKTTTKELLASVLRQRFATVWSEASFNNDIGVPLTLFKIDRPHGAAVLEVGTNHPGELPELLRIIQPRYGVLTNIGREHLEFFGDVSGVAQEEGWLAELLPAEGTLFVNGDNEWTPAIIRRTRAQVQKVGLGDHNDWHAHDIRVGEDGVQFHVRSVRGQYSGEYRVRLLGRHQVPNALLALAVGTELGVTPEEARRGLAACAPPKMRLQIEEVKGVRLLDDSYNANADSMLAALQTLNELPCPGRRIAVLGDMAELGAQTAQAHREVGQRAAELGIHQLVTVGRWACETAAAARAAGMQRVLECADAPIAAAAICRMAQPGDVVLIKGSRAAGLERISERLRGGQESVREP